MGDKPFSFHKNMCVCVCCRCCDRTFQLRGSRLTCECRTREGLEGSISSWCVCGRAGVKVGWADCIFWDASHQRGAIGDLRSWARGFDEQLEDSQVRRQWLAFVDVRIAVVHTTHTPYSNGKKLTKITNPHEQKSRIQLYQPSN